MSNVVYLVNQIYRRGARAAESVEEENGTQKAAGFMVKCKDYFHLIQEIKSLDRINRIIHDCIQFFFNIFSVVDNMI